MDGRDGFSIGLRGSGRLEGDAVRFMLAMCITASWMADRRVEGGCVSRAKRRDTVLHTADDMHLCIPCITNGYSRYRPSVSGTQSPRRKKKYISCKSH